MAEVDGRDSEVVQGREPTKPRRAFIGGGGGGGGRMDKVEEEG